MMKYLFRIPCIKYVSSNIPMVLSSIREKMIQAYEFAVDKVGIDYHSYQVIAQSHLVTARR